MPSTAVTQPRHPLVDVFLSAGAACDEATSSGLDTWRFSFSVGRKIAAGAALAGVEAPLDEWAHGLTAEATRCGPAFAAMTTALVSHVKLCYDLACASPATTSHSPESLHLAYLDTFVEYLTPSNAQGQKRRHGANTGDAKLLQAQAQAVRDAVTVERGEDNCEGCGGMLPMNLEMFKVCLGLDSSGDEAAKVVN